MVVDVTAPRERLVADAQPAFRGALAERAKVVRGAINTPKRPWRYVGADQHQVRPELLHQVELALGPVEGPRPLRLGHPLKVAKRLEHGDLQPVATHEPADLGGGAVKRQEVILEDLDAIEPGRRDRSELLAEIAADRNRGDGGFQTGLQRLVQAGWYPLGMSSPAICSSMPTDPGDAAVKSARS